MSPRSFTHRRRGRGFSLIEVSVAIAILTIGLIGVLALLVVQLKDQAASSKQSQALRYAQEQIDTVRRQAPYRVALAAADWDTLTSSPARAQELDAWMGATGAETEGQLAIASGTIAPVREYGNDATVYVSVTCDSPLPDGADEGDTEDCADDVDGTPFNRTVTVVAVPMGTGPAVRLTTRVSSNQVGAASDTPDGSAAIDPDSLQLSQVDDEEEERRGVFALWSPAPGAVSYTLTLDGEEAGGTDDTSYLIALPELTGTKAGRQLEVCVRAVYGGGVTSDSSCRQVVTKAYVAPDGRTDGPGGVEISWQSDLTSDPLMSGYQILRSNESGDFEVISGPDPIRAGPFTDPSGTCADSYLIRAIPATPGDAGEGGDPEGVEYSTRDVEPTCGS